MSEPSPEELAAVRDPGDFDLDPPRRQNPRVEPKREHVNGSKAYRPDIYRLLPMSPDAEKGLLSSFLFSPVEVGGICAERQIDKSYFAIPAHGILYEFLFDAWNRNSPLDFIALTQILRDKGRLDECGGAAFIAELYTFIETAANAAYYLEILDEKRQLREAIKLCTEISGRCYDEQDQVIPLIEKLESEAMKIRANRYGRDSHRSLKELVIGSITRIQTLYDQRGAISGIPTGFSELDKLTDGLRPNRNIIIAARPSMGKTALAMNIAENVVSMRSDVGVVVFSLEMSAEQLTDRFLCSRAKVNSMRVRDGFLSERDFPALQTAASHIVSFSDRFIIDDFSECTIQYIRAKARRYRQEFKAKGVTEMVVFVDYLQLVGSSSKKSQFNRETEVAEVSRGLKLMAKELGIANIVLAQLNRDPEKRLGARNRKMRPMLSDLRESGSLEQDADDVWFLVRDEVYAQDEEEREELCGKAELIIAKQRNGPLGNVPLTFLKEFTRFETRAREANDGYDPSPKPTKSKTQPKGKIPQDDTFI